MFGMFKKHKQIYPIVSIPLNRKYSSPQSVVDQHEPILGVDYELLHKTGLLTWLIETEVGSIPHFGYPEGKYNFVTMMDETIRITPLTSHNILQHAALANYAPEVRLAGEIHFHSGNPTDENGQQIKCWTNRSEDYPSDDKIIRRQAGDGLPEELFCMNNAQSAPHRRI